LTATFPGLFWALSPNLKFSNYGMNNLLQRNFI